MELTAIQRDQLILWACPLLGASVLIAFYWSCKCVLHPCTGDSNTD
jgi:hypothetical protein